MAAISLRVGLQHPRFDPHSLVEMPFRRSTTIVSDTSGVLQGGWILLRVICIRLRE
jgi:hypothetical protein